MKRLYPDQPMVGVGAVILRNGQILLERRKNDPGKGKWSIPGGLVELGERIEDTVVREVKEETGLDVERPEHIDVVDSITKEGASHIKYHFVIVDYLVRLKGGSIEAASDAEELKWVPLEEVGNYELTRSFRSFCKKNVRKLQKLSLV